MKIKRICSEESEFKNGCEHLKERLKKRGYREENIASYIEKAATMDRTKLLKSKDRIEKKSKIPFVTRFTKTLPNIKPTIANIFQYLSINEKIKLKFTASPIIA